LAEQDVTTVLHERATLAVLKAVSQSPLLLDGYVLKGGFTLFHVFGSPRRSYDLDFTALKPFDRAVTPGKNELLHAFCSVLEEEMDVAGPEYGFATMRVHWRRFSTELPALLARIGYSEGADQREEDFVQYVETQITLSESICETTRTAIRGIPVHVPVLEDILADKLKALLQQELRDVHRTRDLYDLWYFAAQSGCVVNRKKVRNYLLAKCADWVDLQPLTAARFRAPSVRDYARVDYDAIPEHLIEPEAFIPFEEAFDTVIGFVDTLELT
jgi:predicted nucleotidyltransferase component of viral defense system